ncbi:hypothetical protein [Echinimonas agarilytica]|uniref:Uncharacterized protein n=1 Tax=Echinimonas agarilytica TaxID=1215918 RepID=A0AA41W7B4_9GAMM|nr:hypothetical protein [Echinimonas agarilytica]MCM2680011.1 hypothetical protein [Echinimonas agarilytica]
MDYLIPEELPFEFLKSINILNVERVPIEIGENSSKLDCYNNVKNYVKLFGGEIKFGWSFSQLGNIALKLNAHAVVELPDGSLKCVTPSEHDIVEINFSVDNSIASLIVNNRLPNRVFAMVADKVVEAFVKLENLDSKMRLEGNQFARAYIADQKYQLSNDLIKAFNIYQ